MSYNKGKVTADLWAIVNHSGEVVWSRGGSSSSPRLMVYDSQKKAERAKANQWTKQVHDSDKVFVEKIYSAR